MAQSYEVRPREIEAQHMTRAEYCEQRGWDLPENERGKDDGYITMDKKTGHITWLESKQFHHTYKVA